MEHLVVGIGSAAAGCDRMLDLGPLHPAANPGFQIELAVDGDTIVTAEPRIGYMHRGVEKLFEVRDYPAILALANRHDWLGAFIGELGAARVIEGLLGLNVPPRAKALRLLLAEITRLSSHLAFAGGVPGADTIRCWQLRGEVQQLLLAASGHHLHPMLTTIGGIAIDPGDDWLDQVLRTTAQLRPELDRMCESGEVATNAAAGLAVLDAATAADLGVSGLAARAAGSRFDARLLDPDYVELLPTPVVAQDQAGDARARFRLLLAEIGSAAKVIDAAVAVVRATHGPVGTRLPKVIRCPEGTAIQSLETPLGAATWLLDSTGDKVPNRLKISTPSFATLSALPHVLPGTAIVDLPLALRSFVFVIGDADR